MGQVAGIYGRRSVRKYLNEELQVGILEEIREAGSGVKRLYEDIDMDIHIVEDGIRFQSIIRGIIGNLGKIIAPHYIVVTSEKKEGYLENAGFALEEIILSLGALGIGTCFIGRGINHELLRSLVPVKKNHEVVFALSFGYPRNEESNRKRMLRWKKRMEIAEFASGHLTRTWRHILDAVKMAPVSMNTRPWRFHINDNRVDIYSMNKGDIFNWGSGKMNRIALGSALYHIYMAAEGLDREIRIMQLQDNKKKDCSYIASIVESAE